MKRIIYYFSGTGNSLEVATKPAAQLGAETVGIASMREGPADGAEEVTGLVISGLHVSPAPVGGGLYAATSRHFVSLCRCGGRRRCRGRAPVCR